MKVIHYQTLFTMEEQEIRLPKSAEILNVAVVRGDIRLYYMTSKDTTHGTYRIVRIYGTGHDVTADNLKYLGTVQQDDGNLVWHVFEQVSVPQ